MLYLYMKPRHLFFNLSNKIKFRFDINKNTKKSPMSIILNNGPKLIQELQVTILHLFTIQNSMTDNQKISYHLNVTRETVCKNDIKETN